MKKRNLFLVLLLVVIGFASISITLYINGTIHAKFLDEDYVISFTKAEIEGVTNAQTLIDDDGQSITFSTPNLSYVGDKATLKFEITNSSTQYDANVEMECIFDNPQYSGSYHFDYEYPKYVEAGKTLGGFVEIEIIESIVETGVDKFVCKIHASAEGKKLPITEGDEDTANEDNSL